MSSVSWPDDTEPLRRTRNRCGGPPRRIEGTVGPPCDHAGVTDDIDAPPGDDPDPGPEEQVPLEAGQLAYDCAAWAGESRRMLGALLESGDVPHAWQGTTLTVHEADEERVDDLVDEVLAASRPALDPDAPRIVYEVGEWPVALQSELGEALTAADLAYEWDHHGDLVVLESDEEEVAAVLDELPDPDDARVSSDDGVAVHELFDRVFLAADRLARNGADAAGTVGLVDASEVLEQLALPFGFESADWRHLVGEVQGLRSLLDPDGVATLGEDATDVPAASDSEIAERARAVRELLRRYV